MGRTALAVKIFVYAVFLIWLIGVIVCVGFGLQYKTSTDEYSRASATEQQPAQEKSTGVPQNYPVSNRENSNADQSYAAKWLEPMVLLTILLVMGVFITAAIYYGQLKKMRATVALVAQQSGTMKDQLIETRNLVQQNERALTIAKSQTEIMQASHVVTTRSYMDVFRIETMNRERPAVVIKIGNIGAVPAEDIHGFIDVLFSKRKDCRTLLEISPKNKRFPFDFQRTKLFRGKLQMKIQAAIYEFLSSVEILKVFSGDADLVTQITIEYRDGFSPDFRSETFAFRFDDEGGGWFTHPVPIQYSEIEDRAVQVSDGLLMNDRVETQKEDESRK